jgi:hypothetical protein
VFICQSSYPERPALKKERVVVPTLKLTLRFGGRPGMV